MTVKSCAVFFLDADVHATAVRSSKLLTPSAVGLLGGRAAAGKKRDVV